MKAQIVEMLGRGESYSQIVAAVGCSRGTIAYHAKKLGLSGRKRGSKLVYDWRAIKLFYEAGHSVGECVAKFGFHPSTWTEAVKRGEVSTRPPGKPIVEAVSRASVKRKLLRQGLLKNECAECGMGPVWRGKPIVFVLDHINGISRDHRLENLRLLCPNCNSQTDTFSGRNVGRNCEGYSGVV